MSLKPDVIAALRELEDAHGTLTPDEVVAAASHPASALHPCFEWDDTIAGPAYRVIQARQLIVRVRVEVIHGEAVLSIAHYLRDPEAPAGEQGYRNVLKIKSEPEIARDALTMELNRIKALMVRAKHLAIALGVDKALTELDELLDDFIAGLRPTPPPPPPPPPRRRGRWTKRGGGPEARL